MKTESRNHLKRHTDEACKALLGKNMEIKAVIFDMDGVLVDTIEYHHRSWKKIATELGISFSRNDGNRLRGLSRVDSLEILLAGRQISEEMTLEILQRKNDYFIDSLKSLGPQDLLPGVLRLLHELRAAHVSIGISSSSGNVRWMIDKLKINEFIEAIGDRYSVSNLKPDPEVFFYTASALGVAPQNCLVIEDAQAGIQAGQAAGMCVVGVGQPALTGKAHASFPTLATVTVKDLQRIYLLWRNTITNARVSYA
jgi:beta-phosphoglucomutase